MDCNYTIIKTCELKGYTFRSHVFNFGDQDISDYTFSVVFKSTLGQQIGTLALQKYGNTVVMPLESLSNRSGVVRAWVAMEKDGRTDLMARIDITITDQNCGCDNPNTHDVTVTHGDVIYNVTIIQAIVNIGGTPTPTPQWSFELTEDMELIMSGEGTSDLSFHVNDEMELIQSGGEEFDFELVNGFLILKN